MKHLVSRKLLLPGCVLVPKYRRSVTTPKCYPRKRCCILTRTSRHYICHHLSMYKVPIERNPTTNAIARSTVDVSHTRHCRFYRFVERMFTTLDSPNWNIYCWLQRSKLAIEIPPQRTSWENTVSRHCRDSSCTEQRIHVETRAIKR